jgi:hypothetical protein
MITRPNLTPSSQPKKSSGNFRQPVLIADHHRGAISLVIAPDPASA